MAHVLLVNLAGEVVGLRFRDADSARDWEDDHEDRVSVAGCVRIISRAEVLGRAPAGIEEGAGE